MLYTQDGKPVAKAKYAPIKAMVCFQLLNTTNKTHGGLIVPQGARQVQGSMVDAPVAVVLAVGPEVKAVKEGDLCFIQVNSPLIKFYFEGDLLYHCHEEQVMGPLTIEAEERVRALASKPPEGSKQEGHATKTLTEQIKGKRMVET